MWTPSGHPYEDPAVQSITVRYSAVESSTTESNTIIVPCDAMHYTTTEHSKVRLCLGKYVQNDLLRHSEVKCSMVCQDAVARSIVQDKSVEWRRVESNRVMSHCVKWSRAVLSGLVSSGGGVEQLLLVSVLTLAYLHRGIRAGIRHS